MSNLNTYCRRCHKAKHGEGIAPTIQFESTQRMTEREFHWFKHFVDEMIPVMAQIIGTHLNPKFALEEQKAWHIPLGDVYHLDEQLADYEMEYTTLTQLQEYM